MLAGPWNNHSTAAGGGGLGTEWEAAQWQQLDGALSSIFAAKSSSETLCREELYRIVEDVCVEGYAPTLYERVARAMFSAAEEKARGVGGQGEGQLAAIAEAWRLHAEQVRAVEAICLFLDRAYAASTPGLPGIWDVGTAAFRAALKAEPGLENALISGLCAACKRDRDGEAKVDADALRDCCRMLAALKIYGEFEEIMLGDAKTDFAAQARWLSSLDTGDQAADAASYTRAALARIEAAHRAVSAYLESRTLAPLLSTVEQQLVSPLAAKFCRSSFGRLVDSGDLVTLERLSQLLGRVGDFDVVRKATRDYAADQALKVFSKRTTTANSLSEEDATGVVDELLALFRRLSTLCTQRLHADDWGPTVLKDAFEEAVNDERVAAAFAELLAGYFGSSLGSEKRIDNGMRLFRFSRSKDVFEAFYRRELAARLLENGDRALRASGSSSSSRLDAERALIHELETECGASYVSKLEGMCKDVDIAQDVALDYARSGELILAPTVLTVGYWPPFHETNLILPAELVKRKEDFEKFYVAKFQGRRLTWQHDLDRCVLRYSPQDREAKIRELDCTMAQAVVLLSFSIHNRQRLANISRSTALEKDDVIRAVRSLATSKIKLLDFDEDGDEATFDPSCFSSHKSYLIRLPAPRSAQRLTDQERSKVVDDVARDRQYAIDAGIVRVMKARQTLPHQQLVAELLARLKHPATPADIRKRIESLLDREYLERDPHDSQLYNYLA